MHDRNGKTLARLTAAAIALGSILSMPANLDAAPIAWVDNSTGFAIAGYDPVAYHTRKKAVSGDADIQLTWGGVAWRFENTGNRDAFARHPQVYAPQYAGYDPEALARGVTVIGSPEVFAMVGVRVYFFRDRASMTRWRDDAERLTALAAKNWTTLARNLPGTSGY